MSRHALRAKLAVADEAAVVALAITGEGEAFRELVVRREAWVRDLFRRFSGDAALADDLAQQTFVLAWKRLSDLRQSAAFAGWLRRVAVNVWLAHLRLARVPEDELGDDIADDAPGPATAGDRIDLERALACLKPAERLCVVLSFAEGQSHADIAQATGLPLGTVKSHVTRGGARLKTMLGLPS